MWSVDSNILSLLVLSTLLDFINTSRLICVNSGNTRELIFAILVSVLSVLIVCWGWSWPGLVSSLAGLVSESGLAAINTRQWARAHAQMPGSSSSRPIRDQDAGHMIALDQSEAPPPSLTRSSYLSLTISSHPWPDQIIPPIQINPPSHLLNLGWFFQETNNPNPA